METRLWILNGKRVFLIAAVLLILVLASAGGYYTMRGRETPAELFDTSLGNTLSSSSFRFRMNARLGGKEISRVEGERGAPDRVRIRGSVQKMPVEFVRVGETAYFRGLWSKEWTALPGNRMTEADLFVTEFNPLGNLRFKDVLELNYEGKEKMAGEKMAVFSLRPVVQNPYLEMKYDDFYYRVWVDPRRKVIRKVSMTATGTGGEREKLELEVEFWDYGEEIKVEAPG